jgi:TonB family protein
MNQIMNSKRTVLIIVAIVSIPCVFFGPSPFSPQGKMNETDALARQLTDKFGDADKKGVLVMDLATPEGQWLSFGSWLADQLSSSLANQGQSVDVVGRAKLGAALKTQDLSPTGEFNLKNAIALSKSIDANTLVLGSYGAIENGIGVTLVAFRVREYEIPKSTKLKIGMVSGKIALTQSVTGHLIVPLDSLRPKDGIYLAGVGGVSVPSCVRCTPPSMHGSDVDVLGIVREKRNGGTLALRFVVTPEGRATEITVVQPMGYGVDEQYVKAAKDWEFTPSVDADNRPVPVHWNMQFYINFK